MKIVGISGSLRRGSHNTALLRAAASALPPGVELEVFDGLRDLPLYDEDLDAAVPAPAAVTRLREAILGADALLVATPEYNGSIPGGLKNAIDWASRPRGEAALAGVPVAVIGASTGLFGAVWAQAETRKALGVAGADVLDGELPVGQAAGAFGDDGLLADGGLQQALAELVGRLVDHAATAEAEAA